MPRNFKRGFFRAWIVLSVLWVVPLLLLTGRAGFRYASVRNEASKLLQSIDEASKHPQPQRYTPDAHRVYEERDFLSEAEVKTLEHYKSAKSSFVVLLLLTLLPPPILLALGRAVLWASEGFRSTSS